MNRDTTIFDHTRHGANQLQTLPILKVLLTVGHCTHTHSKLKGRGDEPRLISLNPGLPSSRSCQTLRRVIQHTHCLHAFLMQCMSIGYVVYLLYVRTRKVRTSQLAAAAALPRLRVNRNVVEPLRMERSFGLLEAIWLQAIIIFHASEAPGPCPESKPERCLEHPA